jgi:hypothetical protein
MLNAIAHQTVIAVTVVSELLLLLVNELLFLTNKCTDDSKRKDSSNNSTGIINAIIATYILIIKILSRT